MPSGSCWHQFSDGLARQLLSVLAAQLGFEDAKDIGMTCATVGLLAGIFGGLICTKMAARRGIYGVYQDFSYISGDCGPT